MTTRLNYDKLLAQSSLTHVEAINHLKRFVKSDSHDDMETLFNSTQGSSSMEIVTISNDLQTESDDNGKAVTNYNECTPCNDSTVVENVVYMWPKSEQLQSCNCTQKEGETINENLKTIFIITPTYKRSTQKIDLTSMCHTLMHVPNVVWIIIEDAPKPTQLVTRLLQRCKVKSVHLLAHTSAAYKVKKGQGRGSKPRGVEQRNAGLTWLRKNYNSGNCNGVVYFGDDDNKYDLRLFDEVIPFGAFSIPWLLILLLVFPQRFINRYVKLKLLLCGRWHGQEGCCGRGQLAVMGGPLPGTLHLLNRGNTAIK